MAKGAVLPYTCFSENPIFKVDPLGDDDYKVNNKGKISLEKKTDDEKDKLIATGNDDKVHRNKQGEIKSPFMKLDKGILSEKTDLGTDGKQTPGMILAFNNNTELAKRTFDFLADNTQVEFSLITTLNGTDRTSERSSIYTTFLNGVEFYGGEKAKILASGDRKDDPSFNFRYYHSHPHLSFENGYEGRPSGDGKDKTLFLQIWGNMKRVKISIREKAKDYEHTPNTLDQ